MKRLFFTSCLPNRSVCGAGGFQVRAASPTLSPDEQAGALEVGTYYLPKGVPDDVSPDTTPRRLALLDRPNGRRVACHSVYVGRDPGTGRFGNYFTDIVVGRADEFDPLTVLGTWKSPFWRTRDGDDLKTELPDVAARDLVAGPELTAARLRDIVQRHDKLVEFLLHGLLVGDPARRLFVVARPEAAAAALYAALSALPPALRSAVTFSTYEGEHGSTTARVVATTWGDGHSGDLEDQYYTGGGYALNTVSNRRSPDLGTVPAFVSHALETLRAGRANDLAAFHKSCAERGVTTGPEVVLLYRLAHDKKTRLGAAELKTPLAVRLAKELLTSRRETGQDLLTLAINDPAFRRESWPEYLKAIRTDVGLSKDLSEQAWASGLAAAKAGDVSRCALVWEELYLKLAPAANIGKRLLDEVKNPEKDLPLAVRLDLLPRVLAAAGGFDRLPATADWCRARPDHLDEVLSALGPDERAKQKVTARTLRDSPGAVPEVLIDLLGRSPQFAIGVVVEAARTDAKKVEETFGRVVERFPRVDWAGELMSAVPDGGWPPDRLDRCLAVAIEGQNRFDVREWLGAHAKRVRGELGTGRVPAVLAEVILAHYAKEWGQERQLKSHLDWVWNDAALRGQLSKEAQGLLAQQFGLNAFCEKPTFEDTTLSDVRDALQSLRSRDERPWWAKWLARHLPVGGHRFRSVFEVESERVLGAVAGALVRLKAGRSTALESTLNWLSPVLSPDGRSAGLFRLLLARCGRDASFWASTGLLRAFVVHTLTDVKLAEELAAEYGGAIRRNRTTPAVTDLGGHVDSWRRGAERNMKGWGNFWHGILTGDGPTGGGAWSKTATEWIRAGLAVIGLAVVGILVLSFLSSDFKRLISKLFGG